MKARDAAGNVSTVTTRSWTVDTTAPAVTLASPANGTTVSSATPTFSGNAGIATGDAATVTIRVYSGSSTAGPLVETLTGTRQVDSSYSVAASPALSNATYTAQATQSDSAGNVGQSVASTFTVAASVPPVGSCGTSQTPATTVGHVIWIVMENQAANQIIGNSAAPFTNQLANNCGLATNFYAESHPSLPDYIAMTSGSTQGVTDNGLPSAHPLSVPSIFSQAASWKSYEESMPSNCYGQDSYPYSAHHNPAAYYTDLNCASFDIPMGTTSTGALAQDLANNTLPAFAFVTPNQCNNMHDDCGGGDIATGDSWLASLVPKILSSQAYQSGNLALFLTWDEDNDTPVNQVATIVASPYTLAGARSGVRFDHYSMLRTTEELLGINTFLGNAASASSMLPPFLGGAGAPPPPPPSIDSGPSGTVNTGAASFGFSDSQTGVSFFCQLDGGGFSACTSPKSYSALADGSHSFEVEARNAAGNDSTVTTRSWTVDTTPPPAPSIDSGPSGTVSSTSASFGFSDTEAGVSFFCQLDGGGFGACTSPKSYSGLADGSHSFQVKARDAVGNDSTVTSRSWTVNTTAAVPPTNTAPPTIAGILQQRQTLTASPGTWSGTQPITYSYQWQRCGYVSAVKTDAPAGYWRLDETSGTSAADQGGNGNTGTYTSSFTLGQLGALNGDSDTAVRFQPSTGGVDIPASTSLNYGDNVTYEAWIKLLALPPTGTIGNIMTKSTGAAAFRVLPTGQVMLRKSGAADIAGSTTNLSVDGAFHYIVMTKNGSSVHIYVDGMDVTGSVSNLTLTNNTAHLAISHHPLGSSDALNAVVDEAAVYSHALTAAQVAAHYAAGTGGGCANIPGATGQSYTIASSDVGSMLRVSVTASNSGGSSTASSAQTQTVSS